MYFMFDHDYEHEHDYDYWSLATSEGGCLQVGEPAGIHGERQRNLRPVYKCCSGFVLFNVVVAFAAMTPVRIA
jgi:hypothetical protein